MTKTQQTQFMRMYNALLNISKNYQTPDQLRKNCKKDYGLGYDESITMAYENIQAEAKYAVKGIRIKQIAKQ